MSVTAVKTKAPVGPVDILALLAEIKAGKAQERTASVDICINPSAADAADAIYDKIALLEQAQLEAANVELSIGETATDYSAEIALLEAEHDRLMDTYRLSVVKFTFRGQELGDRDAVAAQLVADHVGNVNDPEQTAPYGTARYMIGPTTMTPQEVRNLAKVIGWKQFNRMIECWQKLTFGEEIVPLSRRPSRGPVTAKRSAS